MAETHSVAVHPPAADDLISFLKAIPDGRATAVGCDTDVGAEQLVEGLAAPTVSKEVRSV